MFDLRSNQLQKETYKLQISGDMALGELQKYHVIKMVSSGDYICNDRMGNTYLLVSQLHHSGLNSFKKDSQSKFQRNSSNRALLVPFEDIIHDGGIFTVYVIPEDAVLLSDINPCKLKSEIYCLSLLYSLINKVLKPLINSFGPYAHNWLHIHNIWIKESRIFYVLSDRINSDHGKSFDNQKNIDFQSFSPEKEVCEKFLLRKLCSFLIPLFKFDPELKSFQSIVFDAMLNEEFRIEEIILLLNDKKKRRSFMEERRELIENENIETKDVIALGDQYWSRRKNINIESSRRGLKSKTTNITNIVNHNNASIDIIKNYGETISVPPTMQSRRKTSIITKRLFDFKDSSFKNRSLSEGKSKNRYGEKSQFINVSETIQEKLKTFVKLHPATRKAFSMSLNVAEKKEESGSKGYFRTNLKNSNSSSTKTIDENHKELCFYLNSKEKSKKFQTIDVSRIEKTENVPLIKNSLSISLNPNKNMEMKKQLFSDHSKVEIKKSFQERQENEKISNEISEEFNRQNQPKVRFETSESELLKDPLNESSFQGEQRVSSLQYSDAPQISDVTEQKLVSIEKIDETQEIQEKIESEPKTILKNVEEVDFEKIEMIQPKEKQLFEKNEEMIATAKPPLPSVKKVDSIASRKLSEEDELEEIILDKIPSKNSELKKEEIKQKEKISQNIKFPEKEEPQKEAVTKIKEEVDSIKKTKTIHSEIASSCGPKKPVSKQVAEYVHMINKMGESVAKSSRIATKLEGVEWFIGVYFVYKRFLYERKQIEKYLEKKEPNLTRYIEKNSSEWEEWFDCEEKKSLEEKIKAENANIVSSIMKMNKKIMKKNLPGNFLYHASLSRHSEEESKIAVSEVIKEFDTLEEKQKLGDDEILTHINDLLNSLYIIAEMDGKINEKKNLAQTLKKKSIEELSDFSDFLYDLYIQEKE